MPTTNKQQQTDEENLEVDVNAAGDELEVEITDDTPPEDKGRKPLTKDPLEKPDTFDEADKVTKGVQKRIGELTHKAHDERRKREAAERRESEAVRIAQAAMQRNRMLEGQLTSGEAAFATETVEKAKIAKEAASAKYRKAFEAGDPDAMAAATAELAAASQQEVNAQQWARQAAAKVENAKNALQKENDGVDSTASRASTQGQSEDIDTAAVVWAQANPWFGKNRKMTSYVYGVHEELVFEEGLNPNEDADKYYARIDEEMRERFPDYEWDDDATGEEQDKKPAKPAAKPAARKPAPPATVAAVQRTSTGNGQKVTLNKSEVALAEKLGLTPQQYAREKLRLANGA